MGVDARRSPDVLEVIIVDPDRLFREAITGVLNSLHVEVVGSVSRASELEDILAPSARAQVRPCLVVADFPLDDAVEAARWRAIIRRWPRLKYVYVSRSLAVADFGLAFGLGFGGCLTKNVSIASFHHGLLVFGVASVTAARGSEKAVAEAFVASRPKTSGGDEVMRFTRREVSVLRHIADGASNKRIARQLGISESTVKVKVRTLLRKINVTNRTQAATWAVRNGIRQDADDFRDRADLNG